MVVVVKQQLEEDLVKMGMTWSKCHGLMWNAPYNHVPTGSLQIAGTFVRYYYTRSFGSRGVENKYIGTL